MKKQRKVLLGFEIDTLTNSIVNKNELTNILKNKTMGLVKEPEGVDFIVNSRPLTKKEQEALSNFIKEDKAKRLKKLLTKKESGKRKTSTTRRRTTA